MKQINNRQVNVLLTSVGGRSPLFIWKAIRQSKLNIRLIACDCNYLTAGLYRADIGYVVPHSRSDDYVETIISIIKKENVDLVIPGIIAEMLVLGKNSEFIQKETGAYVVSSPLHALEMANDKWKLVCFLEDNGFDYPRSAIPERPDIYQAFIEEVPFPYIVKERFGAGSIGLSIVKNLEDLEFCVKKMSNPIVQEYLFPDDEEYTIGCFCDCNSNPVGSIVMKRKLKMGFTNIAEVIFDEKISSYCEKIAKAIGFVGPCNLQLRNTERGPVLFEINPRFSSTESARAYYNYNMPEMCIKHFVFKQEIQKPKIKTGHFFRVFDEVFVETEQIKKVYKEGVCKNKAGIIIKNF